MRRHGIRIGTGSVKKVISSFASTGLKINRNKTISKGHGVGAASVRAHDGSPRAARMDWLSYQDKFTLLILSVILKTLLPMKSIFYLIATVQNKYNFFI